MAGNPFGDAAAGLRKAGAAMPSVTQRAVKEATALVQATILVEQAQVAPSARLRGVGRGGARIGVRAATKAGSGLVSATGPAHLLDHDTHRKDGGVRTRGKLYFERGAEKATPAAAAIIDSAATAALIRAVI